MSNHTATAYLILKATRSNYGPLDDDGLKRVHSVTIAGVRQKRPAKLERDEITVRVTVTVDAGSFSPVTADLALSIDPANLIQPVIDDVEPEPDGERS